MATQTTSGALHIPPHGRMCPPQFAKRRKDKIHRWLGILAYLTNGLAILLIVNGPWSPAPDPPDVQPQRPSLRMAIAGP